MTSFTHIYFPGEPDTHYAALIDPLQERTSLNLPLLQEWNLTLHHVSETADEPLIYSGHACLRRHISGIVRKRGINPRPSGRNHGGFIAIMNQPDLPQPDLIDVAVLANLQYGNEIVYAA
ncbi:hypothetical protein CAP31_11155 [Sulfuriferula sp. AH1]|uniref:hypothetical protein n=1 Tax=Sulfuriferula sp. AH1 TaxID=1985873 RepID=UPI000B3B8546|nr:hypothetical protein [Sulfuriferula sp. AH1]ARU32187.1 hypothetical protein CAP31_11155 [Sulfuriferula sp. AH1]